VFVQGSLWSLNPFDQWGVELGKELARGVGNALGTEGAAASHDPATAALVARWQALRRD